MERRERPTWAGVRAIVLTVTALFLLPLQAHVERNWEFSINAFGGKAFHSNEDLKLNMGDVVDSWHGTVHGVTLNDSGTFGGKLSAWYLPGKYRWQPQVGFELDFTRFTADRHPQLRGADGTVSTPGFQLGSVDIGFVSDLSVDTLAANLLFRYPVWSTTDLLQGRIAPYIGIGVGAQRAVMSLQFVPYREVNYAPAGQVLVGMKFFMMKNLAVFGEYKRVWSSHTFTSSGGLPLWIRGNVVCCDQCPCRRRVLTFLGYAKALCPWKYINGGLSLLVLRASCSRCREW